MARHAAADVRSRRGLSGFRRGRRGAAVKRVLLTGAGGFIGREMPRLLVERGYEVHSAGRHRPEGVTTHHICDLLRDDLDRLAETVGATHLLHLAWYTEPGRFWDAPENLDWAAASL